MNGDGAGHFLGDLSTVGRTVGGRYAIRVNGRDAGSERWRLRRTGAGVEARSDVEIAHPVRARYALILHLDTSWYPRTLQISLETPDQLRDAEYSIEGSVWQGEVARAGGGGKEFSGELTGHGVFDFGAAAIHFNTMWMDRKPGGGADVDAVLIQPDLTPRTVRQSYRFLAEVDMMRPDDDHVKALHQSVTTDGPDGIVINHYWTLPNGVPLRSLIVAREILFELVLTEFEGPRTAAGVPVG